MLENCLVGEGMGASLFLRNLLVCDLRIVGWCFLRMLGLCWGGFLQFLGAETSPPLDSLSFPLSLNRPTVWLCRRLNRRCWVGASVQAGCPFWFACWLCLGFLRIQSGCFWRVCGFRFCFVLLGGMGRDLFAGSCIWFFVSKLLLPLSRRVLLFRFLLVLCLRRRRRPRVSLRGWVVARLCLLLLVVESSWLMFGLQYVLFWVGFGWVACSCFLCFSGSLGLVLWMVVVVAGGLLWVESYMLVLLYSHIVQSIGFTNMEVL